MPICVSSQLIRQVKEASFLLHNTVFHCMLTKRFSLSYVTLAPMAICKNEGDSFACSIVIHCLEIREGVSHVTSSFIDSFNVTIHWLDAWG